MKLSFVKLGTRETFFKFFMKFLSDMRVLVNLGCHQFFQVKNFHQLWRLILFSKAGFILSKQPGPWPSMLLHCKHYHIMFALLPHSRFLFIWLFPESKPTSLNMNHKFRFLEKKNQHSDPDKHLNN